MPKALIITTLLFLTALVAQAQEKKPPQAPKPLEEDDVVRITTELVQTDVMVFDKDGKFVPGLKPEQFQLLVDGKPQPILLFESVVTGTKNEAAVLKASRGNKDSKPTTEATSASDTSERGRTVLFFINDLHLAPGSLTRTHKTINNFIDNQLGPNDQVAITSASGQIGFLQQLTDNPAVLRAALDRLKFVPGGATDGERPYMSDYAAYLIVEKNDRTLFDYFVQTTVREIKMPEALAAAVVERRSKAIVRQSDIVIKTALSSLVNLMGVTAKLPGRKLVFFISDGFIPNFTGSDFTAVMRRITDSANRSSVVIYSLDARGLSTDSYLEASSGGGADPSGVLMSRVSGERTFSQEPLHALAADTGGRAFLNSNSLEDGIARALEETSRYYLLAWRPENDAQRASNFSKIKLTIPDRPELKVQLRRGYLGAVEKPKANTETATVQVESTDILGVTESSTEELRPALGLGYKLTAGNKMQLTSSLQVSAHAPDGGGGQVDTGVLGAVFDSKGKAVGSFRQRVEVPRTRAGAPPVYATVNHQVDVAPGLYQVRAIAYERGTRRIVGAMEWIEVPKLKEGAFSISSLYVGEIADVGGASQVTVNASRRFARNSRMRFTTYIYNAAGTPPQIGVQIKILRGSQAVITPPEAKVSTEKLTNFANITYTGEFPLSSLPPGSYVMDVTVNDKTANKSASQQLRFTVY